MLRSFDVTGDLGSALRARGVRVEQLPGLGHDNVLLHLDDVMSRASTWIVEGRR